MPWSAVIVTDTDGTPIGEIPNLNDRRIAYRLRRPTQTNFTVPLRDKLSDALLDGQVLVKLYETDPSFDALFGTDTLLRFAGPVITAEEVVQGEQATLAVVAASPSDELAARLCGKSTTGVTIAAGTQRGDGATQLLTTTNTEAPTLLRPGVIEPTTTLPVGGAGPWRYKPISEAIAELANALDGFDWEDRPVEPALDALGPYCALLDIWAAKGGLRPDAIFEYGTGRHNVRGYRRPITRQGMANQAFSLPPGFPDNAGAGDGVLTALDATSQGLYRLRETVVSSDLTVADLRQKLIGEHVRVRATPRELITFDPQPHGYQINGRPVRVPRFKVDYDTGDIVEFRAVKYGRVRFDGLVRVYGADITLSQTGVATVSPVVQPEGA